MKAHRWPFTWPDLENLLGPTFKTVASLQVRPVMDGHKAILRFANGYGLEIFKYTECDFSDEGT